jgi:hypothetical protein
VIFWGHACSSHHPCRQGDFTCTSAYLSPAHCFPVFLLLSPETLDSGAHHR